MLSKFKIKTPIDFSLPVVDYSIDETKAPYFIEGLYKNDLNILKIHDAIRARFCFLLTQIDDLLKTNKDLDKFLFKNDKTMIEINATQLEIKKNNKLIDEISNLTKWHEYVKDAKDTLEQFVSEKDQNIKLNLISNYLCIAKKYIKISILRYPENNKCPSCNQDYEQDEQDEESGFVVCQCGLERKIMAKTQIYKDVDQSIISTKGGYDDKTHFIKRLNTFEGKQDEKISDILYEQLDEYLQTQGMPPCEQIRKMDYIGPDFRKKSGTSISILIDALKSTNNTHYYKDIELISHVLWGWKLPDISQFREQIIEDYVNTQRVYKRFKEKDSSINVNLRLFWHLKIVGYEVYIEDFKIPNSSESLNYSVAMFKKMCDETNLKYYPIK